MPISREEMLRELELVPMWHLRQPLNMPALTSAATMMAEQVSPSESMADSINNASINMLPAEKPEMADDMADDIGAKVAVSELAAAPLLASSAPFDQPPAPEENTQQEASVEMAKVIPALIRPWLVYCSHAGDADSQQLLQNMLKAMQLPEEQCALVQQSMTLAQIQEAQIQEAQTQEAQTQEAQTQEAQTQEAQTQVAQTQVAQTQVAQTQEMQTKVQYVVLLGLQAANTFLGTQHTHLAEVRGQVHHYGETQVVITHHPNEMLVQPLLKKEAWFDLCLLLAKKA